MVACLSLQYHSIFARAHGKDCSYSNQYSGSSFKFWESIFSFLFKLRSLEQECNIEVENTLFNWKLSVLACEQALYRNKNEASGLAKCLFTIAHRLGVCM